MNYDVNGQATKAPFSPPYKQAALGIHGQTAARSRLTAVADAGKRHMG